MTIPYSERCIPCGGTGKVTQYLGMAGDHDGVEVQCSACHGTGRKTSKPEPVKLAPVADSDLVELLRARAGSAFSVKDYARAERLRKAADVLEGE